MNNSDEISAVLRCWLNLFGQSKTNPPGPTFVTVAAPQQPEVLVATIAALVGEALTSAHTLMIVTSDDGLLPEISTAIDLGLRPLCLVLPGAAHASSIALRATLSLLKSRLNRNGADSQGPAWLTQRKRLAKADALWRSSLAWAARNLAQEAPPAGICELFPVRIGPWPVMRQEGMATDWVVLLQCGRLPAAACCAWPGARTTLLLSLPGSAAGELTLPDETAQLAAELELLGQQLAEMELELATVQAELAAFSARYHAQIGERLVRLDRLQAELAAVRLACAPQDPDIAQAAREAQARAEQTRREYDAQSRCDEEQQPLRFTPSDDLKKRFRQLAQKIHPDRASDETDRVWRTQLMSEANRAYRSGDAAALERVFGLWLAGPAAKPLGKEGAVPSAPSFTAREGLFRQRDAIRSRIAVIGAELDRLYGSKLYELFTTARLAERHGRDLLAEMATSLDAQIAAAENELAALLKG